MKKLIYFIMLFFGSYSLTAQIVKPSVKPTVTTNPDANFLQALQKNAPNFNPKNFKGLTVTQKSFVQLLATTNNASSWGKAAYKVFIKKATSLIKGMGLMADPDDGGQVFADPDDGHEVYASNALIIKAVKSVSVKCPDCEVCLDPPCILPTKKH